MLRIIDFFGAVEKPGTEVDEAKDVADEADRRQGVHMHVAGVIKVDITGKEHTFSPEQIAGVVMGKLRYTAAAKTGEDVDCAVVAVPSSFTDDQRQAVKDAGATVSLDVLRTINESMAAVFAYGLETMDGEQNVVVLDLGASKTDVTVLNIEEGHIEMFATVSTPVSGRLFNRRLGD